MMRFRLSIAVALTSCAVFGAEDPVRYVRTEMGTVNGGVGWDCPVSTGNVFPMTARPWGFGGWAPQTRADGTARWFYDYNDGRLYGIRYTRQPSPWIGDHGAWTFLPVTGEPAEDVKERGSWYSHKTETFGPDRYGVYLADFDVTVDIAPAVHGAVARLAYPKTDRPGLVVNPLKGGTAALADDGMSIRGCSVWNTNHRGWGAPVKLRFVIRLPRKAVSSRTLKDGALYVAFAPTAKDERLELRLATSLVSDAQAEANLSETEGKDFAALQAEARAEWNARLGRIRVDSSDRDRLCTFYTCFYRTMLFPLALWEKTAEGKIVHWSPSTGETREGYYYGGTGFWDTFRALFPLLNFLAPEVNARMMEGLQNCWKESGWLPEWSSPGLTDCMIGNNSASVVADAWLSGVRGNFDIDELWKAVVHGANDAHPTMTAVGRCGVGHYNAKGYVPRDVGVRESAARTLEYAYDDWCIAELGKAIGRPAEEVELYRKRSGNWRNVFDPARKIAVGRNADGTFNKDFDPFSWGGDFTEGCAHHYTWSVFHDIPGLVGAMGGRPAFERRLDEIFEMPPQAEYSYYGRVIHEIREMQIMGFGQYAHGNQPIQHMIYLYDWTDSPGKAGRWARRVMDRLYRPTPDGYCGDEDNGQTSAWFVWSALGLYPVCPASGEYATGCPLFDRIEVSLPNGRTLTIRADGAAAGEFPSAPAPRVRKADLDRGGELVFRRGGEPVDAVNPCIGCSDNGHCFAAAAWPFGLVQAGPDTGFAWWDYCSGYRYADTRILGFSQTHLSGTGCGDLGDVLIMPFTGDFDLSRTNWASAYRKETQVAKPGYYAVTLDDNHARVEVAVAAHSAIYRIAYRGEERPRLFADLQHGMTNWDPADIFKQILSADVRREGRIILGRVRRKTWVEREYSFAAELDCDVSGVTMLPALDPREKGPRAVLDLDLPPGGVLGLRIGISTVSPEAALANLRAEIPDWDLDRVRADARRAWNELLLRAEAVGATDERKTSWYTSLYHLCIHPSDIADVDGRYRGADGKVAKAAGGHYYSTLSLWDTFRAANPLYTLLVPERVPDMVNSMLAHQRAAGFLPIWTLWGKDNQCMIGSHSVPVIVDAFLKGFGGVDWQAAYGAVRDTLRNPHPGRRMEQWDVLDRYGYYPMDVIRGESVSRTLECAYDDACAARFAAALGKSEDAAFFDRRAHGWTNVFDRATGWMRGRDSKGAWREPFDPRRVGVGAQGGRNDFTEGNSCQYSWHVMQHPRELIALHGGPAKFAERLDGLFTDASGVTGKALDVTGLIGQYAHGNEPSHHTIYLFRYAGRGDRTAELVREVCDRFYRPEPDGLCGNDDCGQMSAWYLFSAIGFYPLDPCGGDFVLGAPQVPEVKLRLPGGKTFTVVAKNLSRENKYVKAVRLNGKPLDFILTYADILAGGTLEFDMHNTGNK